jgi:demethylmenaquinone methyltransferase/2-methoxy-6-polyprenyl-1,4-benzoquinol methylase
MLERAPAKAKAAGVEVKFEVADVTNLPYESGSFDLATISFGIRNVQDPVKGLSEMLRVLSSGGRLIVLEFGQSFFPGFKQVYELYANIVLPTMGGWITGRPEAYQYLQTSSAKFPCRDEFLGMIREAGDVTELDYHALTFGIAYIYRAIKK